MQVILDIKNEYLPIDSVGDIELTEDIAEIAEGSSAISAAARKILEMFYGYQYVREAERWEESNMVVHNNIVSNKIIESEIKNGKEKTKLKLRKITFYDRENKREFEFLTNLFELRADLIAGLYKVRWQIEILFWKHIHSKMIFVFFGCIQSISGMI